MQFLDDRLPKRFWDKCTPEPNSGCWLWMAGNVGGYGRMVIGSRRDGTRRLALAHRLSYEAARGPIPAGLELDHAVCSNPSCVNPLHMIAVSHRENMDRARHAGVIHAEKTACLNGHDLTGDNVRWNRTRGFNERVCRTCTRENMRRYRSAKRAG